MGLMDDLAGHVSGDGGSMPTAPVIQAVYPANDGRIIHLYVEGFRTSKPRGLTGAAVCGVAASLTWGTEWTGYKPTGRVHVPLGQALELERRPTPTPDPDPRPRFPADRRFCGKCVGMLLERHGYLPDALDMLVGPTS